MEASTVKRKFTSETSDFWSPVSLILCIYKLGFPCWSILNNPLARCVPVIPVTEAEEGESLEHRSSRPAWVA
jgi:hypothetical protein